MADALFDLDPGQSPAYLEVFVMDDRPDGNPDCYFACNICERRLDDGPCPDHAPLNVPGLQLVECDAQPRHPHVWMVASEAYDPPCMYCAYELQQGRIDELTRCRHWGWRRSRLFGRVASRAYGLGVVTGYGTSFGGGPYAHHGCVHGFHWRGRRPYILGWERWKWNCLFRQRHWPGVFIGMECCAKCAPCPECGSTTTCFYGTCDNPAVTR
ncbi:hypothetical protein ACRYCC_26070 [Actinomadura scrupuli]|uniref:hypothetical protein n=1 Tax=Actinomadura scrupuli TaxID=559629 RepID=UPI003D9797F2